MYTSLIHWRNNSQITQIAPTLVVGSTIITYHSLTSSKDVVWRNLKQHKTICCLFLYVQIFTIFSPVSSSCSRSCQPFCTRNSLFELQVHPNSNIKYCCNKRLKTPISTDCDQHENRQHPSEMQWRSIRKTTWNIVNNAFRKENFFIQFSNVQSLLVHVLVNNKYIMHKIHNPNFENYWKRGKCSKYIGILTFDKKYLYVFDPLVLYPISTSIALVSLKVYFRSPLILIFSVFSV